MLMTIPIMVEFSRLSSVRMRHTGCSLNNFWLCLSKPSGADASIIHFCDAFVECSTAATDTLSGISCHTHNRSSAQENRQVPQWRQWTIWLSTYHRGSPVSGRKFVTGKRVCITASGSYCALGTGGIHGAGCSLRKLVHSFAVMLVVPLGLLGAVLAVSVTNMTNDVFFKVGLITLIGLSAKNAILIIEFARQLMKEGKSLIDATLTAAKLRLRPILMTSLAFTLGVVPLMLASGASASTQHAIGTGVFGGMISGTLLAIYLFRYFS